MHFSIEAVFFKLFFNITFEAGCYIPPLFILFVMAVISSIPPFGIVPKLVSLNEMV